MLAGEIKKLLTISSHIPIILLMGFKGRELLAAHYIKSGRQKLCEVLSPKSLDSNENFKP